MLKIGKRLKQLRLKRDFSQEYLAHALDMTQGNYCKLENDNHFPSAETLEKIASLYNINPRELITSDSQGEFHPEEGTDSLNDVTMWKKNHQLSVELLNSKEKIIALQERQIQILESMLKNVENK